MRRDKENLARRLARFAIPKTRSVDVRLGLRLGLASLTGELAISAEVRDGMEYSGPAAAPCPELIAKSADIDIGFNGGPAVIAVELPNRLGVFVRYVRVLRRTHLRDFPVNIRLGAVRTFEALRITPCRINNGRRALISDPAVKGRVELIRELPHRMSSVDIEKISEEERRSFQREAEALRRIPQERAEVVALFRRLPIEMISRLHYVSDQRAIVYSVCADQKRTRTRLHDMAAIRDMKNGEIHLVPHRTRCIQLALTHSTLSVG